MLALLAGHYRHYAINVLAAATGLRRDEVPALLVDNVKPDT